MPVKPPTRLAFAEVRRPRPREIAWIRQAGPMVVERVIGTPLYDNGSFYVIDVVKGLRYAVMEWGTGAVMRMVDLDFGQAAHEADAYLQARETATADEETPCPSARPR